MYSAIRCIILYDFELPKAECHEFRSMNSSLRDIVITAEVENKQNSAEICSLQKRCDLSF